MLTPNEVQFYEKFQKTFFEGEVDFINRLFNTEFGFKNIQDILLGVPVLLPKKESGDKSPTQLIMF